MTAPNKTKKAKTAKPAPQENVEEYMELEEVLQNHEDGIATLEQVISDHAIELDRINHFSENNYNDIVELREFVVHRINSLFWVTAIGIAVAITFAGAAIFNR
jgi:TolA-binding protein